MGQRHEVKIQGKQNFDPNYYLPSPIYVPSYEEEPPALVKNLVPDPAQEKTLNTKQNKEEERRTMLELSDEENDLDYNTDSESDDDYQTYV